MILFFFAFSALTLLLVGRQEGHPAYKHPKKNPYCCEYFHYLCSIPTTESQQGGQNQRGRAQCLICLWIQRSIVSKYYSKSDLAKRYWQIPTSNEDKDLTTFICHQGLFRFTVMPFGLVNAAATFSRVMRGLLRDSSDLDNYLETGKNI